MRRALLAMLILTLALGGGLWFPASAAGAAASPPITADLDDRCTSALPPPNCGFAPQASGDRGGWMQYTILAVVLVAMALIFVQVVRAIRRRDRALAPVAAEGDWVESDEG